MTRFTTPRLNALWTVGFYLYGRAPTHAEFCKLHLQVKACKRTITLNNGDKNA